MVLGQRFLDRQRYTDNLPDWAPRPQRPNAEAKLLAQLLEAQKPQLTPEEIAAQALAEQQAIEDQKARESEIVQTAGRNYKLKGRIPNLAEKLKNSELGKRNFSASMALGGYSPGKGEG